MKHNLDIAAVPNCESSDQKAGALHVFNDLITMKNIDVGATLVGSSSPELIPHSSKEILVFPSPMLCVALGPLPP